MATLVEVEISTFPNIAFVLFSIAPFARGEMLRARSRMRWERHGRKSYNAFELDKRECAGSMLQDE
jgi:hypothetical protein